MHSLAVSQQQFVLYVVFFCFQLNGPFSIMIKSLFVYGMVGGKNTKLKVSEIKSHIKSSLFLYKCSLFLSLALLLLPVQPDQISVCVEDDEDLRVDCMIKPAPNKINSYEFSWSSGTKEVLINTNVSGSKAEAQFNDKSQVVELEPHGYRMTLSDFKDKLPPNTTYMCKIYGEMKQITVEKGGWTEELKGMSVNQKLAEFFDRFLVCFNNFPLYRFPGAMLSSERVSAEILVLDCLPGLFPSSQ